MRKSIQVKECRNMSPPPLSQQVPEETYDALAAEGSPLFIR